MSSSRRPRRYSLTPGKIDAFLKDVGRVGAERLLGADVHVVCLHRRVADEPAVEEAGMTIAASCGCEPMS